MSVAHHRESRGESIDEEVGNAAESASQLYHSRRHTQYWRLLWRKLRYKRIVWIVVIALFCLGSMGIFNPSTRSILVKKQQRRVARFNASVAYDRLIVVAGHAVLMETERIARAAKDESVWYLLDYQLEQDLPSELVAHIRAGVERAAKEPKAMLLFSGGQTRPDAGPRSEALSYYLIAEYYRWWGHYEVAQRAHTEEYARDSFENLLFSLCRFTELSYGRYPRHLSVVSFHFKRTRFERLHAPALRWPPHRFHFISQNPLTNNPSTRFDLARAAEGEASTIAPFKRDPYACSSSLAEKKLSRDPFHRTVPYRHSSCPKISPLLSHCGPHFYNASMLPWSLTPAG